MTGVTIDLTAQSTECDLAKEFRALVEKTKAMNMDPVEGRKIPIYPSQAKRLRDLGQGEWVDRFCEVIPLLVLSRKRQS